jgi:hypothetical protein
MEGSIEVLGGKFPVIISFYKSFDHGWWGDSLESIERQGKIIWTPLDDYTKDIPGIEIEEETDHDRELDKTQVLRRVIISAPALLPITIIWTDFSTIGGGSKRAIISKKGRRGVQMTEDKPM